MSKELLTKIESLSLHLKSAARWGSTNKSIAEVQQGQDNYLYEFYCYISIVEDLLQHYHVEFVKAKNSSPYKFPKASALKKNSPRFDIVSKSNDKEKYQVCAGTRIKSKYSKPNFHPDISIQNADADDDPTYKDIRVILDAKFKKNSSDKLPIDEISSFAGQISYFDLLNKPLPEIKLNRLCDIFGQALITNGQSFGGDEQLLIDSGIKEVSRYFPEEKFLVNGKK